jgi:ADP-ribose pyrophosphatase YjhB (NUDIX family)
MFTIRVYGILINELRQVLVSDEYIRGDFYTKFPGGGLELGEGTRDCLEREFMEEMNLKVAVGEHMYTTDIYQRSAFNNAHQIVAIYYLVKALEPITVPLRDKPFHFDAAQLEVYNSTNQIETFRFVDWDNFSPDAVTLPLDKIAVDIVKQKNLVNEF